MSEDDGLICAFEFSAGGTAALNWDTLVSEPAENAWLWIHLDRHEPRVRDWLETSSGLDPQIVAALLSDETRPRCDLTSDGVLLILRGVNLNPDSRPEDMVSVRTWIEPNRILTVRGQRILAVQDIRDKIASGAGPATLGDLVVELSSGLIARMGGVIAELDERVDHLEDASAETIASESRKQLLLLRRRAILLRRYLAPQREALSNLAAARTSLFDDFQRGSIRDGVDRITRLIEELDALRERAAVIQDEVSTRLAEQMNTAMYRLSIVATIFLPLSLFTGLLGINVGGIPGTEWPGAFWATTAILAAMTVVTIILLKALGRR